MNTLTSFYLCLRASTAGDATVDPLWPPFLCNNSLTIAQRWFSDTTPCIWAQSSTDTSEGVLEVLVSVRGVNINA